ncbi:MAG: hypothetical protein JNJ75_09550 [Cyclobacteriaceae bacterium]|nr:hypothetical protein [Cyclobacteriaceae bacterium]
MKKFVLWLAFMLARQIELTQTFDEAHYYSGLLDVNNVSDGTNAPVIKQFNRAFQLCLAFRFPGKQLKKMGY